MLHEFVAAHRDEIIQRCCARVGARSVRPPTLAELEYGVPRFLEPLVVTLRTAPGEPGDRQERRAERRDLQLQGFTVSQVVHDYGGVCQSITDVALGQGAPISVEDFRTPNRCLDDAIANAVTEFGARAPVGG